MARSPWRDAIDGKIEVLRGLRSRAGLLSLVSYFKEAEALASFSNQEKLRRAERMALATQRVLADRVTVAEPYSLTNDIQEVITRTVNLAGGDGPPPLLKQTLHRTFSMTDMPSRDGFVWLNHSLAITLPPDASPNLRVAAVLRAIHWASAWESSSGHYLMGGQPKEGEHVRPGIGVTAYLDGDELHNQDPRHLDPSTHGLVPWVLPYLMDGDMIAEHLEATFRRYDGSLFDQTTHTFPALFLQVLVQMMHERILLWGGSGLERDARKAAERAGLKPIVQVVTWRKADYRYPANHIPAKIDWTCRWPVKEHVRHYKNGKVVTIQSYVKGPKGKPLKNPNQRVNLVRR